MALLHRFPTWSCGHRELAANIPRDVTVMAGTAGDLNLELRVVRPSRSSVCPELDAQRLQVGCAEAVIGKP